MRVFLLIFLGAALGAAAAIGTASWWAPASETESPVVDQTGALRDLTARVARLERETRAMRAAPPVRRPDPTAPDPAVAAGRSRRQPQPQPAPRDWAKATDGELLATVTKLRRKEDWKAARAALQALQQRRLGIKQQAAMHRELGSLERAQGRLAEAEQAFRRAIDLAAPQGDDRAWAGYELALVLRQSDREGEGLAAAETALAVQGSSKWVHVHCRWAVATLSHSIGNTNRAKAEYARLLRETESDPRFSWCAEDVRRRLQQLR